MHAFAKLNGIFLLLIAIVLTAYKRMVRFLFQMAHDYYKKGELDIGFNKIKTSSLKKKSLYVRDKQMLRYVWSTPRIATSCTA